MFPPATVAGAPQHHHPADGGSAAGGGEGWARGAPPSTPVGSPPRGSAANFQWAPVTGASGAGAAYRDEFGGPPHASWGGADLAGPS
jgi:hypothetical protein